MRHAVLISLGILGLAGQAYAMSLGALPDAASNATRTAQVQRQPLRASADEMQAPRMDSADPQAPRSRPDGIQTPRMSPDDTQAPRSDMNDPQAPRTGPGGEGRGPRSSGAYHSRVPAVDTLGADCP